MKRNTIAAQEARLAVAMLTPAIAIVLSIVILPVLINLWISAKPVRLGDLRPPTLLARRSVKQAAGEARSGTSSDELVVRYILRNSSQTKPLRNIRLKDTLPGGYRPAEPLPAGFAVRGAELFADLGQWEGGMAETTEIRLVSAAALSNAELERWEETPLITSADSENILTNFKFTLANYREIIQSNDFVSSLWNTIIYTFGGASGAVLLGLIAALLVNQKFPGRGALRVLLLFPYVAPIIAVAFTWQFLLDPLSGFVNELLRKFNLIETEISFLSQRPTAMISVIFFDAWRYSPFAYLFILARLQAIPKELYESAIVDGAGIMRTFWNITLPQLSGILGTIFLLRFIWTFNRFDDIFLLTGGAAGTKTLPIAVYDNAIGLSNIGRGSATAVLLFLILTIFLILYTRFVERKVQDDD